MNEQPAVEIKIVIGLTGNIATGKSAVMRLAADRGALTIDADKIVHDILNGDVGAQEAIAAAFGERVRLQDGRINRAALGEIVFNNAEALAKLEQIVHPRVGLRIADLIQESTAPVVMIEAIKLLEGQLWMLCREIWVTACSYERQLQRLEVCRGMAKAAAEARIKAQSPAEEKITRADVVINTDGLMQDTEQQFAQAWTRILNIE
ncbi:MAG: dephospho-CoA kinase [Candidatus Promineifilaceae bacterium]